MKTKSALLLLAFVSGMSAAGTIELSPLSDLNLPSPEVGARDVYGDKVLEDMKEELLNTQADMKIMESDFKRNYERLQERMERQHRLIYQRQEAINFIRRSGSQRYYTVRRGSLRLQMEALRVALGLQTIRWDKNIPMNCDWMFDASFNIDKRNQIKALESFFAGLPLLPQVHTKDNSATISPLEVIKCD